MIKAIFYKEWIKMRCFYPLSALFLFGATAYALLYSSHPYRKSQLKSLRSNKEFP